MARFLFYFILFVFKFEKFNYNERNWFLGTRVVQKFLKDIKIFKYILYKL